MLTQPRALLGRLQRIADVLLERARAGDTPLLVDALSAGDLRPLPIDVAEVVPGRVLSNLAAQQAFLRFLVGLSHVTGDGRYLESARDVVAHAFARLVDASGLLFWGGHVAFDVHAGRVVAAPEKGWVHELKCHFPFYELMFAVDAPATIRFIEAFWDAHVLSWPSLDFNRHGRYGRARASPWDHEYSGRPVFFWGDGLTFCTAGADLYYAAGMLAAHTGDEAPLAWARRLAARYVETRWAGVGLSAYQFSQKATAYCNGPAVRGDRARHQLAPAIPGDHVVYESTLFRPRPAVQRCQLLLGRVLGARGEEFRRWALEEIGAWAKVAYRRDRNVFLPMLTDGHSLEGLVLPHHGYFGRKGGRIRAVPADADFFWLFAAGYNASGCESNWHMARDMARHLGLGELGDPDGRGRRLAAPEGARDWRALCGLMEAYEATGAADLLACALQWAEAAFAREVRNELFVGSDDVVRIGDARPLVLLRVAAAALGASAGVPAFPGTVGTPVW